MTDFRFPERWLLDRRFSRLPGDALAAYVCTGAWCASNRTEGAILRADLADVPRLTPSLADLLTRAGVLVVTPDGWQMIDYADTQTSRAELEAAEQARRHEREKKRRQRAHGRGDHTLCTPDTCDLSRGTSRGTSQARTGQARTGQDHDASTRTREAGPTTDWPVAPIPADAVPVLVGADPGYCRTHGGVWPCRRDSRDCERSA